MILRSADLDRQGARESFFQRASVRSEAIEDRQTEFAVHLSGLARLHVGRVVGIVGALEVGAREPRRALAVRSAGLSRLTHVGARSARRSRRARTPAAHAHAVGLVAGLAVVE